MQHRWSLAASLLVCAVLAGCAGDSAEQLVASGRKYLAENNPTAAAIQLKNALQKKPDDSEIRLLLGQALLDGNDPISAAIELRKVVDRQQSRDVAVPLLARAMLGQGAADKVIEEFGKTTLQSPAANADLRTSVATAYAIRGKVEPAERELVAALEAVPDFVPALIVRARLHIGRRDVPEAFRVLDHILTKGPASAETLQLQGDLLSLNGRPADALDAYRRALPLAKDRFAPRAAMVTVLLAQSDFAGARQQIDELRKDRPGHPQAAYFLAELAFRQGDLKTAREMTQELLKVLPDNPRVLQLAGALEVQERSYLRANRLLVKALQFSPDLSGARFLLAQVYVGTNEPAKALSTLTPLLDHDPSASVLRLAATAHMLMGDLAKADELFERVLKAAPGDVRARTAMALTDLRQGQDSVAFGELESIAASDAGTTADMALITAHVRRKEYDQGLSAVDALERKQPGKPIAEYLRGRIHFLRADFRSARRSLDKALVIDPVFLPAIEASAALDLLDHKSEAAEARFKTLLKAQPDNFRALLAMARLREKAGAKREEVAELMTRAVHVAQDDPAPRLALIEFWLRQKDVKQALAVAREAATAFPESVEVQDTLGGILLASGDIHQAVSAFNRTAALSPQSVRPLLRLAEAHAALRDNNAAAESLRRALALAPDDMHVTRRAVEFELSAGRPKEALALARSYQVRRPGAAFGYSLEADIEAVGRNWGAAAAGYRRALERQQLTTLAEKLHMSLLTGGKRAEAAAMAAQWLKDHPEDAHFLFFLANLALAKNDFDVAEERLQRVVKINPNNAAAHSSLAWVLWNLKQQPGAAEHARQANKLQPNHAAYMDLLAMILGDQGKLEEAIGLQKQSVRLEPQNHLLRLNLAKLYVRAGDKAKAQKELEPIASLGAKSPLHKEVQKLQAQL